jgi:hypothetical protein
MGFPASIRALLPLFIEFIASSKVPDDNVSMTARMLIVCYLMSLASVLPMMISFITPNPICFVGAINHRCRSLLCQFRGDIDRS